MASKLHLAAQGIGKTDAMLSLLRGTLEARAAFPCAWILLATRRQELRFRERLALEGGESPVHFNAEFFNFYSLNARLLRMAGQPVRRLDETARFEFLRVLLRDMLAAGELGVFHGIADTRGFVTALARLFDELKQNQINEQAFASAARTEKDRELAEIYARYQAELRRQRLADVEGEGWLALAKLREQPQITAGVDLLIVDGFDQFTRVQAQLLAALARSIPQLRITLTGAPDAVSSTRSQIARQRLEDAFAMAGESLRIESLSPQSSRHADLETLSRRFFAGAAARDSSPAIKLIAMPAPVDEARAVLRDIKRRLLDSAAPEDILIALRDWNLHARALEAASQEYHLPLQMQMERPPAETPAIYALLDTLDLPPRFRRRALLDVLRSPYIDAGMDDSAIDLLDRISRERQFIGGSRREWLLLVQLAQERPPESDEHDADWAALSPRQADSLSGDLGKFLAGITPPQTAALRGFVAWLDALLGNDGDESAFSLRIRRNAVIDDSASSRRDARALGRLDAILREMLAADDALSQTGDSAAIAWAQFHGDLRRSLESPPRSAANPSRRGMILATTATEARGLPHKHVYILGLAEGVFPAETAEDPFYLESERASWRQRGIPLESPAQRSDDQGLFHELLALPSESLTLSRPRFKDGKPWLASHLWRSVQRVFSAQPVIEGSPGEVLRPKRAASHSELILALSNAPHDESASRYLAWLQCQAPGAWKRVTHGRDIELRRMSNMPHDEFSGVLSQSALLDEVADLLGADRKWSASQLKDYGVCGFRFFAKRLLKLEEIDEPAPGADVLQLGSLQHSILEHAYRRIRDEGLAIDAPNRERALELFADVADDLLDRAPQLFNFRATATWQEEKQVIRKRLAALIENDFSDDSPLRPYGGTRHVERLEQRFDNVEIRFLDTEPIIVRGVIDRIDRVDGKLALVDYKSGSAKIPIEQMTAGRDFQMLVYLHALGAIAHERGERVAGGMFWHLRNLKSSGELDGKDDDHRAALDEARQHIARNVQQGRQGKFPVHARELENGKCVRYCEFAHLCRRNATSRFKGAGS